MGIVRASPERSIRRSATLSSASPDRGCVFSTPDSIGGRRVSRLETRLDLEARKASGTDQACLIRRWALRSSLVTFGSNPRTSVVTTKVVSGLASRVSAPADMIPGLLPESPVFHTTARLLSLGRILRDLAGSQRSPGLRPAPRCLRTPADASGRDAGPGSPDPSIGNGRLAGSTGKSEVCSANLAIPSS